MQNIYPVITLYQPWATWIIRGWKTIETRTHNRFTSLKGKSILIHAGQTTDSEAANTPYLKVGQIIQNPDEVINGYILGAAMVYDSKLLTDEDSKAALIDCGSVIRYGLFLKDIVKFEEPIPVKGEMGIWYFDLAKKEKVKKANINSLFS
jgi:hypothetical protein